MKNENHLEKAQKMLLKNTKYLDRWRNVCHSLEQEDHLIEISIDSKLTFSTFPTLVLSGLFREIYKLSLIPFQKIKG